MTEQDFWIKIRKGLLEIVDAVEWWMLTHDWWSKPRTAELRRESKHRIDIERKRDIIESE